MKHNTHMGTTVNAVTNTNIYAHEDIPPVHFTREQICQALDERHSPETQTRLSGGRVAIAGLGGLGSNVAFELARIGVGMDSGHLHLIDFDTVDLTNLNRQQYFLEHVGLPKTEALKSELLRINPYLHIRTDYVRVTEDNICELFCQDDIICEAFDVPEAKALLVSKILEHFSGKKLIAASGLAGYESSNLIRTRRLSPNFYLCGDEITEAVYGKGLMAPRAALCAAHEANMITRLLMGESEV